MSPGQTLVCVAFGPYWVPDRYPKIRLCAYRVKLQFLLLQVLTIVLHWQVPSLVTVCANHISLIGS